MEHPPVDCSLPAGLGVPIGDNGSMLEGMTPGWQGLGAAYAGQENGGPEGPPLSAKLCYEVICPAAPSPLRTGRRDHIRTRSQKPCSAV
jgi:hypothetical protein